MIKTTTRMARTTAAKTPAITAVLSSGSFGGVPICVIKSDGSSCIIIETTQMNKTIIMNKIIQSEKSRHYLLTSSKRHTSLVFRFHRCLFNKWHYHTFHNSITETYLLGNSIPLIEIKQRRGSGEDYLMVLK